jgi:hypothetical protein
MHALHELQSSMTRAILTHNDDLVSARIAVAGARPASRLAIYRNNTFISLTEALQATFPVVARVVDERFFRFLASAYIKARPPREPCLADYGATFAGFVADFEPCRQLPYLPDLARLEWAVNEASLEAEEKPVSRAAVASVDPLALAACIPKLQPSVRLVVSRWPVLDIWRANQSEVVQPLTLERKATRVLVRRKGEGVTLDTHSRGRFRFLHATANGAAIGDALSAALARDPQFRPADEILALFDAGLVAELVLSRKNS